jgi:hypothetical protein
VNLKYGGQDVTETFVKMMLHDHFPYADINLWRNIDDACRGEAGTKGGCQTLLDETHPGESKLSHQHMRKTTQARGRSSWIFH